MDKGTLWWGVWDYHASCWFKGYLSMDEADSLCFSLNQFLGEAPKYSVEPF